MADAKARIGNGRHRMTAGAGLGLGGEDAGPAITLRPYAGRRPRPVTAASADIRSRLDDKVESIDRTPVMLAPERSLDIRTTLAN